MTSCAGGSAAASGCFGIYTPVAIIFGAIGAVVVIIIIVVVMQMKAAATLEKHLQNVRMSFSDIKADNALARLSSLR